MPMLKAAAKGLAALLVAVWLMAGGLAAQGTTSEKISSDDKLLVRTHCIMPKAMLSGYFPVQITLENRYDFAVDLQLSLGNHRAWGAQTLTTGTVSLEPNEVKNLEWLAYQAESGGSHTTELHVTREGRDRPQVQAIVHQTDGTLDSGTHGLPTPTLVVSNGGTAFGHSLIGKRTRNDVLQPMTCAPHRLSTDWRAYSTLAYVVLDLRSTPPDAAQLEALLGWTSTGGNLLLVGNEVQAQAVFADFEGLLDSGMRLRASSPEEAVGLVSYRHGFGRIQRVMNASDLEHLLAPVLDDTSLVMQPIDQAKGEEDRTYTVGTFSEALTGIAMQIPGLRHAPPALLTIILLVFVIVVGPVQMFRQKRRNGSPFRFLFVTPMVGIGCAVLILAASLLHQGISVRESVFSMTWLDQQSHTATTLAKRYTFSGSLFREDLQFSGQTAIAATSGNFYGGPSTRYLLDLDDDGAQRGDFLPVRFPVPQALATVATARGRVSFEEEGGTTYAVNGLDTALTSLSYRPAPGRFMVMEKGEKLEPGARIALREVSSLPAVPMPSHGNSMRNEWDGLGYVGSVHVSSAPPKLVAAPPPPPPESGSRSVRWSGPRTILDNLHAIRGHRWYIAHMEDNPFLEDGGISRETIDERHLLIGIVGEAKP